MDAQSGEDGAGGLDDLDGLDGFERVVLATTLLAVLARLVALGDRPFHWDEARVGYWALRYAETGAWVYRPVAGGPLLYHLLGGILWILPASDALARLPVALVGGLFPLAALLFRDRLDGAETATLAAILAASPPLLYYSRFLRGDVPLAVSGLLAVGFAVRYRDRGGRRNLYGVTVALVAAVSASAFAVGYLACWAVAAALVFDHRRLRRASREETLAAIASTADWARTNATTLARAGLLAVGLLLFAFAPRAGSGSGPGLLRPTTVPATVDAAFVGSLERFLAVWVEHREGHPLVPAVGDYLGTLAATSLPVLGLALAGFLIVRYVDGPGERPLVMFAGYWAGAGLLVFPVAAELLAPWTVVHVVVALALPAAVAGGRLVVYGARGVRTADASRVAVAALLVLSLGGHTALVVAEDVYGPPRPGGSLVQYGQPRDDLEGFRRSVAATIEGNDGTDVLYVGERFYVGRIQSIDRPPVPEEFGARLPLPWYLEGLDAEVDSIFAVEEFPADPPPVVVTQPRHRETVADRLPDYRAVSYRLALWNRRVVVLYDTTAN